MSLPTKIRSRLLKLRCRYGNRVHGGQLVGLAQVRVSVPLVADGRGKVILEPHSTFGCREAPILGNGSIRLQARLPDARITIGAACAFSNNVTICALQSVTIGDRCLIGDMVTILDADHHEIDPANRWSGPGRVLPVSVGNNVWLGSRVMILPGVSIGDNSVIGAGSIVTRSIPPNSVAAGNPARIIRNISRTD